MTCRTGPTNVYLQSLIQELKKASAIQKVGLWVRIADDLSASTRQRRVVNLSRINRYTKVNETVVVPGKVLGSGNLDHSVVVAAWNFSSDAKAQIEKAKGKCLSIADLIKQNPKGKDVRIIG